MAKSKKKQPKRYLFEEVLAFLKHNDGKSFNYKQLGAAMEIDNESDRNLRRTQTPRLCD